MKQIKCEIIHNEQICHNTFEISLRGGKLNKRILPGHFMMVKVTNSYAPLLRRPFAFSSFNEDTGEFSFIYQIRGKGTEILSNLKKGDTLDIIAPLGKPFPLPSSSQKPILVAGGIGIGPILFLAEKLREANISYRFILGCKSKIYIPQKIPQDLEICTDDGSSGFKGTVIDYLNNKLTNISEGSVIYCCGPLKMLYGCHNFSLRHNIKCFVSLDTIMACGVGVCMGCTVKLASEKGFARVCKEGAVFDSREIEWKELILQ
ncbi:MAG: dihydroorotate dehydrogenase electron transfer subunit [Chitinispirillaceae bacterium]|nr:dihydroorotate dehydrogenase electron transfer subunit [Chitinispirillaceae bacterium]